MQYENLLLEYGLIDNAVIIANETKVMSEKAKIEDMISRLEGIDPDLDDLLHALVALYDANASDEALNANLLLEFGVIDSEIIQDQEKKRLGLAAMIKTLKSTDTNLDNLVDALQKYKGRRA